MKNGTRMNISTRWYLALIAGVAGAGLISGCGKTETQDAARQATDSGGTVPARSAPAETSPAAIPAPDIPEHAQLLESVYPALSGGALRLARLTDSLPDGVLLQAEGLVITLSDLEAELEGAPPAIQAQMRQNAFFLLEQKATGELLLAKASQSIDGGRLSDELLIQRYFTDLLESVSVSDDEVDAFYTDNREMIGDAPLDQIRPSIRQHLIQMKQQATVEDHIGELGRDTPIAVSQTWIETQAALALDNPLDRARASGIPTFASFGADSCMPCQQMKPFREAIAEKYGDRLNVVYVHVNKDQVLGSRYGVRGIPHIMFFDADGREVHAGAGFMTQDQLEEWIAKIGVEL